uniref:Putative secreted protein n=1 Tax=Anopheles triannulatus TaxID=58253 RepID=A0A2M4B546_9DIPT
MPVLLMLLLRLLPQPPCPSPLPGSVKVVVARAMHLQFHPWFARQPRRNWSLQKRRHLRACANTAPNPSGHDRGSNRSKHDGKSVTDHGVPFGARMKHHQRERVLGRGTVVASDKQTWLTA